MVKKPDLVRLDVDRDGDKEEENRLTDPGQGQPDNRGNPGKSNKVSPACHREPCDRQTYLGSAVQAVMNKPAAKATEPPIIGGRRNSGFNLP